MEKNIGIFKLYSKKPNNITYGYLFITEMVIETLSKEKTRTIRVWVPGDYNPDNKDKRYSVIYMSDGQNLVDKYTSPFGEWNIEDHIKNLKEQGYPECIIVGVDCPKDPRDREGELCPPYKVDKYKNFSNEYGHMYGEFIMFKLKPLIDSLFNTNPDKAHTGVGGSSMGGIMSFYLGVKYKEYVGFSLCFSPGFLLYKQSTIKNNLKLWKPNPFEYGKFFFYVGGKDYEAKFIKTTNMVYEYMKKNGFDNNQIGLLFDSREIHHEDAWSKYFEEAYKFLIKKD